MHDINKVPHLPIASLVHKATPLAKVSTSNNARAKNSIVFMLRLCSWPEISLVYHISAKLDERRGCTEVACSNLDLIWLGHQDLTKINYLVNVAKPFSHKSTQLAYLMKVAV